MTAASDKLLELGWDDSWAELAAACPTAGLPGRVTRVDRGVCTVMTEHGPVRASWSAALLDAAATDPTSAPCTGDWCVLCCWPDGPITIQSVLDRRTAVIRSDANRTSLGQVLVANVDLIAAVVALHPEPNISRIERLMTLAWESGARPIVVLTKLDLVPDGAGLAAEVRTACPGVDVVACSTVTGAGLDDLRALIGPTGTLGLIGASGHGKSTLTNALVGAEVLTAKQIRDDGKGRHTSVRRELVPLPGGGSVIDTPGLRGVGLSDAPAGLAATFPDIEELAGQCKFRDCSHDGEPGCAIRTAIGDGRLAERRLDSWRRLQRELARVAARSDARLRSEQSKRWKKITQQHRTPRRGR